MEQFISFNSPGQEDRWADGLERGRILRPRIAGRRFIFRSGPCETKAVWNGQDSGAGGRWADCRGATHYKAPAMLLHQQVSR